MTLNDLKRAFVMPGWALLITSLKRAISNVEEFLPMHTIMQLVTVIVPGSAKYFTNGTGYICTCSTLLPFGDNGDFIFE